MPTIHLLRTFSGISVIILSLLLSGCSIIPGNSAKKEATKSILPDKPNIIVILTDDQHYKTVEYMPILKERLAQRGVIFDNAIASIPECSPFRASLLAGGFYPKNTNTKANFTPHEFFNDQDTLAVSLSEAGYATGFIGKYKHGYRPGEVPPGWTSFVANDNGGMIRDWFSLKNITFGSSAGDNTESRILERHEQYLTYFSHDEALRFIRENAANPFFLFVSTYAPHVPANPPEDETSSIDDFTWDEHYLSDLTAKPEWVHTLHAADTNRNYSRLARKQILSLQAVDRMIGAIDDLLIELSLDKDTIFIFASDNGIMLGEHDLSMDKGFAYEPSLRVPLVVRAPGVTPRREDSLVAVNLDLAATITDIAGARTKSDGISLLPLIFQKSRLARDSILIENYGYLSWRKFGEYPVWSGFRTPRWKYIENIGDRSELYDLKNDPNELNNLADDKRHRGVVTSFAKKLKRERGLSFTSFTPPEGTVGKAYEFHLTSAWSQPPYRYDIVKWVLPPGLTLDETTGIISGVPTTSFSGRTMIRVRSARLATQNQQPEQAVWSFQFKINEQPDNTN